MGLGGLGCPAALYLAAAGVGCLGLLDFDVVDKTNIHRQILYTEQDIGKKKIEAAKEKLLKMNSNINVKVHEVWLSSKNALDIIKDYDLVVDGADNFSTKYLINDACVFLGKPCVYGSVYRLEGRVTVLNYKGGPCFRCVFPEPPHPGLIPTCADGGVLGVAPGIIGSLQACEAIKIILNREALIGRLLLFDGFEMQFKELKFNKNPNCIICSENRIITELKDYEECAMEDQVEPEELKELLEKKQTILIDVREQDEWEICHIEGAKLIPLGELEERVSELKKDEQIILYCHHGGRSQRAAELLKERGFKKVKSLSGGIAAWAEQIEPEMARY